MSKKYQVTLPIWMDGYINYCKEKYGLSSSDILRIQISLAAICLVDSLYPEYQPDLSLKEICIHVQNFSKTNKDDNERIISKISFEARKAMEYRLKREKAKPNR